MNLTLCLCKSHQYINILTSTWCGFKNPDIYFIYTVDLKLKMLNSHLLVLINIKLILILTLTR